MSHRIASTGPAAGLFPEAEEPGRVQVLLPYPFDEPYDYLIPPDLAVGPGDYVRVTLGPREVIGVVWGTESGPSPDGTPRVAAKKLKPVLGGFDVPPMPAIVRRFVDWVASYTLAPRGAVLRMAMGSPGALQPARPQVAYRLGHVPQGLKVSPARKRLLELAADGMARPAAEWAELAGCGMGVVRGLADSGVLETVLLSPRLAGADIDSATPGPALSPAQAAAAAALVARIGKGFQTSLLDGVTGSGKTEVYFEAVAAALQAGRQALILLPEIALSTTFLDRFAKRFGSRPALWHSEVPSTTRRATWRGIASGEIRVVVGARSALFLPLDELGVIIVDEEHEPAFKQEDGVIYHARDMAIVRAQLSDIPIMLVSATPSLETVVNAENGRYDRLDLPARHGGASLPEIKLIDLRRQPPPRGRFLAPALVDAVTETLARGEQAMLFLNRRGYAPLTLCRACGHRMQCPNCTAWLVEHRFHHSLQCHHCGHAEPVPESCPNCSTPDAFVACGPGVERIAEEAGANWPEARVALLASDTVGQGFGTGPGAIAEAIRRVQDHEVDLIIGTQIVAKGHHFPMLTLVGVVDGDLGLSGGDLRASERTYQLLHQVAGRAGRAERPGRVLMQTWMPEHRVMQALISDRRDEFLKIEAEERQAARMPPFARLVALILSGPEAPDVDEAGRLLARSAPRSDDLQVLGPAPAPLSLLRGRHRRRLLIKARRDVPVQKLIREWLAETELPRSVRVQVDIDPYSFL